MANTIESGGPSDVQVLDTDTERKLSVSTMTSTIAVEGAPYLGSTLVVGGCGFLGHTLVKMLLDDALCTDIHVMCRSPFKNHYDGVTYHIGDITSLDACRSVLNQVKPQTVINTASPHAYVDHKSVPDIFAINVLGNQNLLQVAAEIGTVQAFVYTSSAPIIAGSGGGYDHADEEFPTLADPKAKKGDPYHVAKALGDKLVLEANRKHGIRTCTIRPTALYGGIGDGQMVGPVVKAYEDGFTWIWMGKNNTEMDVVHVENVARCHVLAAQGLTAGIYDPSAPKVDGEAFNVTDDEPAPPLDIMRKYWALCGDKTPVENVWKIHPKLVMILAHIAECLVWAFSGGQNRPTDLKVERLEFAIYTRTYSIKKARELLGYKPWDRTKCKTQDEGVKEGIEWYLQSDVHGPLNGSWPEIPFKLISDTGASTMENLPQDHYCIKNARFMARTHNTIFRALNSIYQHATHIQPDTQDAVDLLEYCGITYDFLHHHALCEERVYFPEIEKAAGITGLMDSNVGAHRAMEKGLEKFRAYVETTRKEDYNATNLRGIIDDLKDSYQKHQHDEIQTILALHDKIPSETLKKIDLLMRAEAERQSDIFKAAPFVMGCQDRNFILDGEKRAFPSTNVLAAYTIPNIVDLFMSGRHARVWKFNPSSMQGKPKPFPKTNNTVGVLCLEIPRNYQVKKNVGNRVEIMIVMCLYATLLTAWVVAGMLR